MAGTGLAIGWAVWPRAARLNWAAGPDESLINAYLKIGPDGRITVAVAQAEMGQGIWSALAQIIADELGADWQTVGVEPAPLGPDYANPGLALGAAAGQSEPMRSLIMGAGQRVAAFRHGLAQDGFRAGGADPDAHTARRHPLPVLREPPGERRHGGGGAGTDLRDHRLWRSRHREPVAEFGLERSDQERPEDEGDQVIQHHGSPRRQRGDPTSRTRGARQRGPDPSGR